MSIYKIENILVPVDLSESALNALDTAVNIAKAHEAKLHILYVDENNFQTVDDFGSAYSSNLFNAADVIGALVGAIQHAHGLQPGILQEEGNVADMIVKASFLHHADLIVMGAHGASGYREGFIGNNTYNVMKYASCPVLSVPQKKKVSGFKKILFPIRPVSGALTPYEIVSQFTSPKTTMEVLGLSYRMVETPVSVLDTIVHEIKDQLEKDQVSAKAAWTEGSGIAEEIVRYASKVGSDLIVITNALDVTSKPRYIGPHAQKIIHSSKAPVLSIKKLNVPSMA